MRRPRESLRPWFYALSVVVAVRVLFIAVAWAASWFSIGGSGFKGGGVLDIWNQWDAANFLRIAQDGYTDPNTAAYFPLFPKMIAGISALGIKPVAAGMLINSVACVVAFAYLFKLADRDAGRGAGRRAVLYLALAPLGVFLVAPYTEAVFLAGAIPAFYYAREGRWHLAGVFAAIATGARFAGLFVIAGIAVEFLRRREFSRAKIMQLLLALGTGLAPFAFYMLFLDRISGNPWLFVEAQRRGWGRGFVGPVDALVNTWHAAFDRADYPTNWIMAWRIEIIFAFIGLGLIVWAAVRKEWGYATYMAGLHAVMITNSWYYSVPRAVLTFFPAAILLASYTGRKPQRHEPLLIAFSVMATAGVVTYTRGGWFF